MKNDLAIERYLTVARARAAKLFFELYDEFAAKPKKEAERFDPAMVAAALAMAAKGATREAWA
jgi:serine protease inhibitor